MAKITIEIDTNGDLTIHDEALLLLLATFATARTTDTAVAQTAHPQTAHPQAETPAIAPKAARKKVAPTNGAQPAEEPKTTSGSATGASGLFAVGDPGQKISSEPSVDGEVTLPMLNALMIRLLAPGSEHNAEELTAIVKEVTHDTAISPKHCDPKFWPEIHARFEALG
jgi:hypothetical protein